MSKKDGYLIIEQELNPRHATMYLLLGVMFGGSILGMNITGLIPGKFPLLPDHDDYCMNITDTSDVCITLEECGYHFMGNDNESIHQLARCYSTVTTCREIVFLRCGK